MNKELAKTLTTALVQFIDREIPEGTMCCSSAECERIESSFKLGDFPSIEQFVKKKLSRLTEFERDVRDTIVNALTTVHESSNGQISSSVAIDDNTTHLIAAGLLKLAKKEFARRNEVIILDKLSPYEKGLQDGKTEVMTDLERAIACGNVDNIPRWLQEELNKAFKKGQELSHEDYLRGYDNGYKDAEKWYNNRVASSSPIMPTPLSGWGCDGTHCTNPQMDCINCPRKNIGGGFNMQSGTSAAKAEG